MSYQICSKCVMDTSDPEIVFNEYGVCNHCSTFDDITSRHWHPDARGEELLTDIILEIKSHGKDQDYDCILGLSGGVDSSYLALKVHDLGLRPLVVHVDAGWNSELAVSNIEKIVKYCNYDLHTHMVDWEEMCDLHLAYLEAGIANQDVPQDHIFFSSMYHFAIKNGIRYILSGGNLATESVFPTAWHGSAMDAINLKDIHRKFGKGKLVNYKTISFFEYYFWYPIVKKMRTMRPLNYMPYGKDEAIEYLEKTVGWRSYGRKHGESIFTKLFQNYYLPEKFGYDKRRPHLSSLIISGQMTRAEALTKLDEPLYDSKELKIDIEYFCKKLRITEEMFCQYISMPNHHYSDYKNWDKLKNIVKLSQSFVERISGKKISVYS